jgi:hypothetical protein
VLTNAPAAAAKPAPQPAAKPQAAPPPAQKPGDRVAWLLSRDAEYAHEGLTKPNELLGHVRDAVDSAGNHGTDETKWDDDAWALAAAAVKGYVRGLLLRELDRLLDAKGEDAGRVLAKLKVKAGTSFTMLDGAQLRQAIGWLRPLEDAPTQGGRKSA